MKETLEEYESSLNMLFLLLTVTTSVEAWQGFCHACRARGSDARGSGAPGAGARCSGDFFAEAAQGGLRDDLGRDLERERQMAKQVERVRQHELVKEHEAHGRRDDELDHGL